MFESGLLSGDGFSELRIWLVKGAGLKLDLVNCARLGGVDSEGWSNWS